MIKLPANKEEYGYLFGKELYSFTYETELGKVRKIKRKNPSDLLHIDLDGRICYVSFLSDEVVFDQEVNRYFVVEDGKGTLEDIVGLREVVITEESLNGGEND